VVEPGADGLVLFNRFYQPDLDLDTLEVVPRLELSSPGSCACRCAGSRSCARSSEYESVEQLRGSVSYATADDPSAFERANYLRTLHSWTAPHGLTPSSPSG
jgi:hypothetical protein